MFRRILLLLMYYLFSPCIIRIVLKWGLDMNTAIFYLYIVPVNFFFFYSIILLLKLLFYSGADKNTLQKFKITSLSCIILFVLTLSITKRQSKFSARVDKGELILLDRQWYFPFLSETDTNESDNQSSSSILYQDEVHTNSSIQIQLSEKPNNPSPIQSSSSMSIPSDQESYFDQGVKRQACRACRNTGNCVPCNGTGQTKTKVIYHSDWSKELVDERCKTCGGSGLCRACGGDGWLDEGIDY